MGSRAEADQLNMVEQGHSKTNNKGLELNYVNGDTKFKIKIKPKIKNIYFTVDSCIF